MGEDYRRLSTACLNVRSKGVQYDTSHSQLPHSYLTAANKSKVVNTENINIFSKNSFDKVLCVCRSGYIERRAIHVDARIIHFSLC